MKQIKIKCQGNGYADISELSGLQGNLKELSQKNLEKLCRAIMRVGFVAPVFIWEAGGEKYIIDGHQRVKALQQLSAEYEIPPVPIVTIKARDKAEAKKILLSVSSQYGEWDSDAAYEWINEIDDTVKDIVCFMDVEIDLSGEIFNEEQFLTDEKKGEAQSKVRSVNCPKCQKEFEIK